MHVGRQPHLLVPEPPQRTPKPAMKTGAAPISSSFVIKRLYIGAI